MYLVNKYLIKNATQYVSYVLQTNYLRWNWFWWSGQQLMACLSCQTERHTCVNRWLSGMKAPPTEHT